MIKCGCKCHRKDEFYPAVAIVVHPINGPIPICVLCFNEYSNMTLVARILNSNSSFYSCSATKLMLDGYLEWLKGRILQDEMVES